MIKIENISAGYDGKTELHNVSLVIGDKGITALTGPNGGGKTTLIRVILGLLKPTSGRITYLRKGKPVERLQTGYLSQQTHVDNDFPISVEDVVATGLYSQRGLLGHISDALRRQATEAMRTTGIDDLARRPIKALSGGELQRVLLARAIVAKPELLVLDEPDTFLDSSFTSLMYDVITRMSSSCSVIIASHDENFIDTHASALIHIDEEAKILR